MRCYQSHMQSLAGTHGCEGGMVQRKIGGAGR
jgi:hypothetical protein